MNKLTFNKVTKLDLNDLAKFPDTCFKCEMDLTRRPKTTKGIAFTEMDKETDWTEYNYLMHGCLLDPDEGLLGKLCDDCMVARQKAKELTDDFTKEDMLNQEINPQKLELKDSKQVCFNLDGHKTFSTQNTFGTKYRKSYVPDLDKKQIWINKYLGV